MIDGAHLLAHDGRTVAARPASAGARSSACEDLQTTAGARSRPGVLLPQRLRECCTTATSVPLRNGRDRLIYRRVASQKCCK